MRLNHLTLTDHRNIKYAELTPDPHLTVLCGPNGQGKTNLLEAVWLLTGGKSFRGSKDAELIRRGCDFSVIEGEFETEDCAKTIRLTVGSKGSQRPGRTAKLNGVDQGRAAALLFAHSDATRALIADLLPERASDELRFVRQAMMPGPGLRVKALAYCFCGF